VEKNQKYNQQKRMIKEEKKEGANLLDNGVQEKYNLKIIQLIKKLNKSQLQIKNKRSKIKIKILDKQ
jgi:hypothetical protein